MLMLWGSLTLISNFRLKQGRKGLENHAKTFFNLLVLGLEVVQLLQAGLRLEHGAVKHGVAGLLAALIERVKQVVHLVDLSQELATTGAKIAYFYLNLVLLLSRLDRILFNPDVVLAFPSLKTALLLLELLIRVLMPLFGRLFVCHVMVSASPLEDSITTESAHDTPSG